jgi:hypothetical protein
MNNYVFSVSRNWIFTRNSYVSQDFRVNIISHSFTPTTSGCGSRLRLKCDGTRAETRFRLLAKRTSPFKWAGASVQSTTGSRVARISDSNARYTMLRGSANGTVYPLRSPVSPSLPLPFVTVCYHISTGLYLQRYQLKRCIAIKLTDSIASNEGFVRVLPALHMHRTGISDSCMHTFHMQNRSENVQTTMGQHPALN